MFLFYFIFDNTALVILKMEREGQYCTGIDSVCCTSH